MIDVRIVHDALRVSEFGQVRLERVNLALHLSEDAHLVELGRGNSGQILDVEEPSLHLPDVLPLVVEY